VEGPFSVKVVAVNVRESIPLLNVAAIFWLTGTAEARFAGTVEVTVGAVVSVVAQVLKLQTKLLASALPEVSWADVVIVAVYVVLKARLAAGAKIAVLFGASKLTVPVTELTPVTKKVAVVIVKGFIAFVNVAVIFLLAGSQTSKLAGFVELIWGAIPVTVNICALVVAPEDVTVTFWATAGALTAIANVAVIWVLLTTDVALTVIPVPLKLIVAPVAKPDPVSVTGTLVPWAPLFALIELSVSVVTAACS
jgi:hypothetical protein